MNQEQIFSKTQLSLSSFKELLPTFFNEIEEDFKSIKIAYLQQNLSQVNQLAHKIKGCASCYSAVIIHEKAKELQEILKTSKTLEEQINNLEGAIHQSYKFAKKKYKLTYETKLN